MPSAARELKRVKKPRKTASPTLVAIKFGDRLREARRKRGYTQAALEEASGISQPRISNYENANQEPDLETLLRLSAILNTPVCELLGQRHR